MPGDPQVTFSITGPPSVAVVDLFAYMGGSGAGGGGESAYLMEDDNTLLMEDANRILLE